MIKNERNCLTPNSLFPIRRKSAECSEHKLVHDVQSRSDIHAPKEAKKRIVAVHKAFMVLENIKMVGAKKVYSEGGLLPPEGVRRLPSSDIHQLSYVRRRFFSSLRDAFFSPP